MDQIKIAARVENLNLVLEFVAFHVSELPFKVQNQIAIAVEEIFVNIAYYAYSPAFGDAEIRVDFDGETAVIEFEDSGVPYNPLKRGDPDVTLPAEERGEGGMGIFLVKKLMDGVEYRREGDKNILTLKKGATAADAAQPPAL